MKLKQKTLGLVTWLAPISCLFCIDLVYADPIIAITNTPNVTPGGSYLNDSEWKGLLFSTSTLASELNAIEIGLNCRPANCLTDPSHAYPTSATIGISLYSVEAGYPSIELNSIPNQSVNLASGQRMYSFTLPNWQMAANSTYALVLKSDATGVKWGATGNSPGGSLPIGLDGFSYLGFSAYSAGQWTSTGVTVRNSVVVYVTHPYIAVDNSYSASQLGVSLNPVFEGGTLQMDQPGAVYAQDFTLSNVSTNKIDQYGNISTFNGHFTNASGSGDLLILNSGTGGKVIFAGIGNTYSGSTTINSGATLVGGIANAFSAGSAVTVNTGGVLDLGGYAQTIDSLYLSGGTLQNGALTGAISSAGGVVNGVESNASLTLNSGLTTLQGVNNYTGGTLVNAGASLSINSGLALGSGVLNLVGNSTTPATLAVTNTTTIDNPITVEGDPVFDIASGTTTTINSAIADGGSPGDLVVQGEGVLELTAANAYTGPTTVASGSTLALSGSGSIAQSSAVNNNGTLSLANASSTVNVAGNFTQSSTGHLVMANLEPATSQLFNITGSAALGGTLSLNATAGTYAPHRYTLLTAAGGVSSRFTSLVTNLSSVTRLGYALSYGANDVYLNFTPNVSDTQAALEANASALRGIYAIQTGTINNSLTYDCSYFDKNGICLSTGGRYSHASNSHANTTSAMVISAYRIDDHARVGAYMDQNLYNTEAGSIASLRSNTPLLGLFAVWNENADLTGFEAKLAAGYNNSKLDINRVAVGASELAYGKAGIDTISGSATLAYGFELAPKWITSPYFGVRHTTVSSSGYSEHLSNTVTAPLIYKDINQESLTALLGIKVIARLTDQIGLQASAGLEQDMHTYSSAYSASGLDGLTAINFSPNMQKSRAVTSGGVSYDFAKGHRLGLTGIYRQESFQSIDTKMVYINYTMAF